MPNESALLWARVGLQAYPPQGHPTYNSQGNDFFMFLGTSKAVQKARIHVRLKECVFGAGSSQCCY